MCDRRQRVMASEYTGHDSFAHIVYCYGAKRTRTADPLNAIEVLYQLSYSPE